jgi:hypothetical protein
MILLDYFEKASISVDIGEVDFAEGIEVFASIDAELERAWVSERCYASWLCRKFSFDISRKDTLVPEAEY